MISKDFSKLLITLLAIAILLLLLFPILWIVSSSIRPYGSLFTTKFRIIPEGASLDSFRWVLFDSKFWLYAKNTALIYTVTISSSLLVTIPAAYGFSRFSFRGKIPILNSYFILAQFMSGMSVIGLIGLYLFLVRINLVNSKLIVGLIYAASSVPFVTWYLKTYFDSIPREYDEAAFIDGATFFQNLTRVIVPMSRPGILVAIIFISIMTLSEWVIAGLLLGSESYTLAVALVTLQGRWETPWNHFAAMSLVYCIPIVILFMITHKNFEEGITMSGLTG